MTIKSNNECKEICLTVSYFRVEIEITYENQGTVVHPLPVPVYKEEDYFLIKSIEILINESSCLYAVEEKIMNEISDIHLDEELICLSFQSVDSDFINALKERPFIRIMMR